MPQTICLNNKTNRIHKQKNIHLEKSLLSGDVIEMNSLSYTQELVLDFQLTEVTFIAKPAGIAQEEDDKRMTLLDKVIKKYAQFAALSFCLVAAGTLMGCVPAKVAPESAAPAIPVADAFAAEVAAMTTGTAAVVASPFGADSQVRAGEFYTSGLGQTCRHATVTVGNESHRMVICKDGDNWYTAAPIFEGMPR